MEKSDCLIMNRSGEYNRTMPKELGIEYFSPLEYAFIVRIMKDNELSFQEVVKILACERIQEITKRLRGGNKELMYEIFSKAKQHRSDEKRIRRKEQVIEEVARKKEERFRSQKEWMRQKSKSA